MALKISEHAWDRWRERFGGDMLAEMRRAVPFGAQRGLSRYLRNGDAVFVVTDGVVVTVLTHHQAVANMQMTGIQMRTADIIPAQICQASRSIKEQKRKKRNPKMNAAEAAIHAFLERVMKCDDDDLAKLFVESRFSSFIGMLIKLKNKVRNTNRAVVAQSKERAIVLQIVAERYGAEARTEIITEAERRRKESEVTV